MHIQIFCDDFYGCVWIVIKNDTRKSYFQFDNSVYSYAHRKIKYSQQKKQYSRNIFNDEIMYYYYQSFPNKTSQFL